MSYSMTQFLSKYGAVYSLQLQFVTDPIRRNGRSELDGNPDGIRYIINQLIAIRDEDAQTILPR